MSHNFSGQSPSLHCNNMHQKSFSGILLLHSKVVSQLPKSQLFTGCFSAKSVALQSIFKSDIMELTTGYWFKHCMGSASAEWSQAVSIYCGSHIGHQIAVLGFSSLTHKEGLKHWAHRDTRH